VVAQRRLRILERLLDQSAGQVDSSQLCRTGAEVTGMSGAGIMLLSAEVLQGSLCSSNPVSERLQALQYELGEGPSIDAHVHDRPVLEPDLAAPAVTRWIAFTSKALDAGARAVFGFPMRVGAVRLGALTVYCDRPGGLSDDQHADALVMADVAAHAVLAMQAGAPMGQLAAELQAGADFHDVVHQATGMVAVQLGVSVAQALIRLRGHAFADDRTLDDVARDVVARVLRFDDVDDGDAVIDGGPR
jgi:hypothetical protein